MQCQYCGSVFREDERGNCVAFGAPMAQVIDADTVITQWVEARANLNELLRNMRYAGIEVEIKPEKAEG